MKPHPFTQQYTTRQDCILTECGASKYFSQKLLDFGMKHPDTYLFKALWDTGANRSAISKKVVEKLQLDFVAYSINHTAGGVVTVSNHLISLILPNNIVLPSLLVSCSEIDGADTLLGMTSSQCATLQSPMQEKKQPSPSKYPPQQQ